MKSFFIIIFFFAWICFTIIFFFEKFQKTKQTQSFFIDDEEMKKYIRLFHEVKAEDFESVPTALIDVLKELKEELHKNKVLMQNSMAIKKEMEEAFQKEKITETKEMIQRDDAIASFLGAGLGNFLNELQDFFGEQESIELSVFTDFKNKKGFNI